MGTEEVQEFDQKLAEFSEHQSFLDGYGDLSVKMTDLARTVNQVLREAIVLRTSFIGKRFVEKDGGPLLPHRVADIRELGDTLDLMISGLLAGLVAIRAPKEEEPAAEKQKRLDQILPFLLREEPILELFYALTCMESSNSIREAREREGQEALMKEKATHPEQ